MLLREEDIPLLSDIGFYPLERRYAVPWRQEIMLLREREEIVYTLEEDAFLREMKSCPLED